MKKLIAILLVTVFFSVMFLSADGTTGGYTVSAAERRYSTYQVGDTVIFGVFEQDNVKSNGAEPIEWIILENEGETFLLVSKYGLYADSYHWENTKYKYTTWETSTMRAWLNNDFLNGAFTEEERAFIVPSTIVNDDNPVYDVEGGNDTTDHVYMLSHDEAMHYFPTNASRRAKSTPYANAQGVGVNESGYCYWWLRTPGRFRCNAEYVVFNGAIDKYGSDVGHENLCARPVIKVQQKAFPQPESIALDQHDIVVSCCDVVELTAAITPVYSENTTVWSSSDTDVVTVDEAGALTIVGLGQASVTVQFGDQSDSCDITVVPDFAFSALGSNVSITDPGRLRFGIQIVKDRAYEKSKDSIVSYGTLIIPNGLLGDNELTLDTDKAINVTPKIHSEDSTQLTYVAILTGIPESRYDLDIACRGYLIYADANGNQHTIYTDQITRSYNQTALAVYERYNAVDSPSEEQKLFLDRFDYLASADDTN